jgi:hypothetical protein
MDKFKRLVFAALKILLAVEISYLILVNGALQLSLTQDLVNKIRPDKFRVSWDNAWSWFPFRVHAEGIWADGQSRSQQWQVRATSASGSISLLPLVLKRVHLRDVEAQDVDYSQRPRLKPERDYSAMLPYFPEIRGREVQPANTSPRKKKRPWKVSIRNGRATGTHSYWIFNARGGGEGEAFAEMDIESRGGPLRLDIRELDLELGPAFINGDNELFRRGHVVGQLGFAPFVPRENKGLRMLPFLEIDALLDLDVHSLGFINLFTANLGNLVIDGAGLVQGPLRYSQGYMLAGTDLTARARDLAVRINEMDVNGQGVVRIHTPREADKPLGLDVDYDTLEITRDGDTAPFLAGDSLRLRYKASNYVVPDPDMDFQKLLNDERARERRKNNTLRFEIKQAKVLDMSLLNDYLPAQAPLRFTGGTASLEADVFAGVRKIEGFLELVSTDLQLRAGEQDLEGNLSADVVLSGGEPRSFKVDLDGSTLTLDEVVVAGEANTFDEDQWSAVFHLDRAQTTLRQPIQISADYRLLMSDTRPAVAFFDNQKDPPAWFSSLLTLRDVEGEGSIETGDERIVIPHAQVLSDKAEIAAKAEFSPSGRKGVLYARYKKLDLLLKMEGDKNNIDVIRARSKFDSYQSPSL